MNEEAEAFRARAAAAMSLATSTRDRSFARLLFQLAEEFEEEACKLESAPPQPTVKTQIQG